MNCEQCKHFIICSIRKQRDRLINTGAGSLNSLELIKHAVAESCSRFEEGGNK